MSHTIRTHTDFAEELTILCDNLSVEHNIQGGCTHNDKKSYSMEKIILESSVPPAFDSIFNTVLDKDSDEYLEVENYYSQYAFIKNKRHVLFFDETDSVYHLPNTIRISFSPTHNFERTAEFEVSEIDYVLNDIAVSIFLNPQEYNSLIMSLTSEKNLALSCRLWFEFSGKTDDLVIGKDINIKLLSYFVEKNKHPCIKLKNFALNVKL